MNDFSELENQLRDLQPVAPSDDLVAGIARALAEAANCRASAAADAGQRWTWVRRFTETPYKIGLAAAAAAVFLIYARIHVDQPLKKAPAVATTSPAIDRVPSEAAGRFVPAAFTEVVYNRRDEGLEFPAGYEQPMRRIRLQKQETVQWRNPTTGATLNVSYPAEEVSLVHAPGQ